MESKPAHPVILAIILITTITSVFADTSVLRVRVDSELAAESVIILARDGTVLGLERDPSVDLQNIYILDLSQIDTPEQVLHQVYEVVAKIPGHEDQSIEIRIPNDKEGNSWGLSIVVSNPKLEDQTIREFASRRLSGTVLYRTYYESRNFYENALSRSPNHATTHLGAFWYFTSAFEVAKQSEIVPMDKRSIIAAEKITEEMHSNRDLREILEEDWKINLRALQKMIGKARRLEWKDYNQIKTYAQNESQIQAAIEQFKAMLAKYEAQSAAEKENITLEWGINSTRLCQDITYFCTLIEARTSCHAQECS